MTNKRFPSFVLSFIAAIWLGISGTNVQADQALDEGLERLANEIKKILEAEKRPNKLIVGDFSGVPLLKSSGGVEISRSMKAQLESVGITISDDAETQVMGRFKLVDKKEHAGDEFDSLAMKIEAQILDGDGEEIKTVAMDVFGKGFLQIAGAPAIELPQDVPEAKRQEVLRQQMKAPQPKVEGGKVMPTTSSPFAVEILVRNGNSLESRPSTLDSQNRPNVVLHQGEEYIVRLHNMASFEAAVTLTLDGVDMFVDAKDAPKDSRIIVAAGKSVDVPGWYIDRANSKAFEISGYEKSVAKRVGNSTDVGMISAAFRASWAPDGVRPGDEPRGLPKGGKATTQGRDLLKNYELVSRDFGDVRAVVSVRYDR
jgi:hypothetical protein